VSTWAQMEMLQTRVCALLFATWRLACEEYEVTAAFGETAQASSSTHTKVRSSL
jgi:hypothetical protein